MSIQHKELAQNRWEQMTLAEQLANIGSEVSRALNWKNKNKINLSRNASIRALELLDLSLESTKTFAHLKELARLREAIVDFFFGSNEFSSCENSWRKYFDPFAHLVRKNH